MSESRTDWLRHPLVSVVLGFILTGVLGTAITQHFLDQRAKETMKAQIAVDRKKAVEQFSELNESRKVRAEILLQALRGADDDALKSAKQEYEKAYVAWSVGRQNVLLMLRDLLDGEDYRFVEARLRESLVGKIYTPMRRCLLSAFGHQKDRLMANKALEECRIDELLEMSGACGPALAAAVSDLSGGQSAWASDRRSPDPAGSRKRNLDSIQQACP